jgi:large subunit ribosomal protein L10
MRAEKQFITSEYLARLNSAPFFIVVNYRGLTVTHFSELRKRLRKVGGEIHVVKNSVFQIAAKQARSTDLAGTLNGQLAVVTGKQDISASAKVLKTFGSEFDKPKVLFGYLNEQRFEADALKVLADLPPMEVLRARLLGAINAPATQLAQIINAPGQKLASVIKAYADKGAEK